MPEWTDLWPIVSAIIAAIGFWRRHRIIGSFRRFRNWCFDLPTMAIRLQECEALCRAYEEAMGMRTAIRELRAGHSNGGNGSKSGSGDDAEEPLPTSPTTPPS